jgi:hypothetical protein
MLFQSYFDGEQKLVSQTLLTNAPADTDEISKPNQSNFSYGVWIYVSQWINPTGDIATSAGEDERRIFARNDELGLYLESNGSLTVRLSDMDLPGIITKPGVATGDPAVDAVENENYTKIVLTNNFPLQKWVHVGLVVDGKKFDGYIDGKMVKSIGLTHTIKPAIKDDGKAKKMLMFGNDNSMADTLMIAEHKRRTYPMDPKAMWDLYMAGNGVNGLTKAASEMNVNLSILKDGVVSSKFSLLNL